MIKELEYTKWEMHNTNAHNFLTYIQTVPKQQLLATFLPSLCAEDGAIEYGISLWSVGISYPGCHIAASWAFWMMRWDEKQKSLWFSASTAQQ